MLLGMMLRTRREQLDLSVFTVAARMGVPVTLVREWEAGSKPRKDWLRRIERAYELPIEELERAWEVLDRAEVEELARKVFEV